MASILCVILVITTWFSAISCAPAKNLYPQITAEAFNETERKLRSNTCFYPADKEIEDLRSNCVGSSDNQLSVCNQTLTLGLSLCAQPSWREFTGQHINPEYLYEALKHNPDICAIVNASVQQWQGQQLNDAVVSLVRFLTATPLVDVNNCRSTCQNNFNIICQLHGVAVIKLIGGLMEMESKGRMTSQQSGVAPAATKSPASGGNLPSGKDSQALQGTGATGNPPTQPSIPSEGNSNANPPSGNNGSTAPLGGAGNTTENGGAKNTTENGGGGNTALGSTGSGAQGGAGSTADKGDVGTTAEKGGAGTTAEKGRAGTTAEKGGAGTTAEKGDAGTTAEKGGAGTAAEKGDAGTTAEKGGVGSTADKGGVGSTADKGSVGSTADKGGVGSTADKGGVGSTAGKGGVGSAAQQDNNGSTAKGGNGGVAAQPNALGGNEKKPDELSGGEGQKIVPSISSLPGTTQAPSLGGPTRPADGVSPSRTAPEGGQGSTVLPSAAVVVTPPKPNDKGTLPDGGLDSEETLDGTDDDFEGEENGVADQKTSGKGDTAEGTGKGLETPGDKGQGAGAAIKKETQSFNVHDEEPEMESSGHFMAYFLTAAVLCIAGYVIFHNKQKIIAFIVEGRSGRQRRRLNGAEYKKLQSNVEEVMPALDKTTAAKNFIY